MQHELDGQSLIHELAVGYVWLCENCHVLIKRGEKRWQCQECVSYNLCNRCHVDGVHDHHEKILENEDRLVLKDRVNANCTNVTINNALGIFSHRPCLGVRHPTKNRYVWSTYGEIHTRVLNLAGGLVHLNIVPNELTAPRTFVSICAKNCLEWFIADYALLTKAVVVAPIHFTISDSDMSFIVNNSGSRAVVCSTEFVERFLRYIDEDICSSLKFIIVMNANRDQLRQKYPNKSCIYSMDEIEAIGADKHELKNVIPLTSPDDLLTLVYTSGSTGTPKGAMIPDRVINESLHSRIRPEIEVWFALAPLAHISDRQSVAQSICNGTRAAIFERSMDFIFEDISIVRPTVISATPRLFNVLYSEYQKEMQQLTTVPTYIALEKEEELMDRLRSMLGDRVETIITGGAPTSPQVFQFLHACFPHCNIVNGYGTTEVGTIMSNGTIDPNVDYKLEDVPDMGYRTSDLPYPRGELLVKTNKQFSGYYNNEALNQDVFDKDGYYRTGDIVEIAENETMRVIDRKKNIFKLAQGEFIAPESLENAYIESPLIDQIYVYGNTTRSYVVAVVVPKTKEEWTTGLSEEQVCDKLIQEMRAIAKRRELQPYEVPRAILLENERFSPENGKLTGTLKIARFFCERVYKEELEKLYDSLQSQEEQQMRNEIKELMNVDGNNTEPLCIDSLHAVRLVSHLKRKYNVDVPLEFIVKQNASLNDVTSYVINHQHEASSVTENTEIDWTLESRLDLDYTVPSYETSRQQSMALGNKESILLTGCTGFLGSFLLQQLLLITPDTCRIYCIVRANNNERAQERVVTALKSFKLWEDEFINRIVALKGSLSKPNFGLDEDTYSELAEHVQVIYHNAANVNHIASYRELKADNVIGTLNLLRFASTYTAKVFHYISTISVPANLSEIEEAGGYAQTKYVSEQLVNQARDRGLLSTIYRPGMISGDTVHGCCNTSDWVSRLIQCCLAVGFYPDTEDSTISMIPVDVAADIILYLSQQEASLDVSAYRVVSPHCLPFDTLLDYVTDVVPMRRLAFETWYSEVKTRADELRGRGSRFEAVLALFSEGFNSKADAADDTLNQALVNVVIPSITAELVSRYVTFLQENQ